MQLMKFGDREISNVIASNYHFLVIFMNTAELEDIKQLSLVKLFSVGH